jgi:hypothetical protein
MQRDPREGKVPRESCEETRSSIVSGAEEHRHAASISFDQTLKAARWTSHRSPSPRRYFAPSVFISPPDALRAGALQALSREQRSVPAVIASAPAVTAFFYLLRRVPSRTQARGVQFARL